MLVDEPNLCACMEIKPIEFRHMAEQDALARLGRISLEEFMQKIEKNIIAL